MDLFELRARIEQKERAILVGVEWTRARGETYSVQDSMAELAALAATAGVEVVCQVVQRRAAAKPPAQWGGRISHPLASPASSETQW